MVREKGKKGKKKEDKMVCLSLVQLFLLFTIQCFAHRKLNE